MATTKTSYARPVCIVDGLRTPFIKAEGKPGPFEASDLAVNAGKVLLARQPFAANALDEVILGCVAPGPNEANIARLVALRLGCGDSMPAFTVQRNCASGLQALDTAALNIAAGRAEMVLAGGTESMSHSPILFGQKMVDWLGAMMRCKTLPKKLRHLLRLRLSYLAPVIGLKCGLSDPLLGISMGQTAENVAYRFNINRVEMDAYAANSHQRLLQAQQADFMGEVVPLYDDKGNVITADNGVREDSTAERLAKLRPVFDRGGNITAGNSAQVTDGAALLILASEKAVEQHNLPVLGKIIDAQWSGLNPAVMGLGPAHAMLPLLQRQQLGIDDIDNWEINEAFAAQVLGCLAAWQDEDYCKTQLGLDAAFGAIPMDRLNVDGGGISLGHPVGASGARIVLHLLHTLKRNQRKRGIASLCIGVGQGGAMMIEQGE
ncbi:MAG: acetyl-CoA C-acetyltransferase [Methylococcales bacterium]|jgi:acetyl-CoA C-acetyltransferase|nr:acetyl-CoA C-acetyltransferase [Methylococcales bacterium]